MTDFITSPKLWLLRWLLIISPVVAVTTSAPQLLDFIPGTVSNGTTPLTILPIGDSITEGFRSSDGNGYRLDLRNLLVNAGYNPSFVGALFNGTNNPSPQHSGYGGRTILEIQTLVLASGILLQEPDLVLLMAGTNDVDQIPPKLPYDLAPERLGIFLDVILLACPNAAVLVAEIIQDQPTIVHNTGDSQARVDAFNAEVPGIVAKRAALGRKVAVVDQSGIGGDGLAFDGLHPNDQGYQQMAQNWFDAIENLPAGWIEGAQAANTNVDTSSVTSAIASLLSSAGEPYPTATTTTTDVSSQPSAIAAQTSPTSPVPTTSGGQSLRDRNWAVSLLVLVWSQLL